MENDVVSCLSVPDKESADKTTTSIDGEAGIMTELSLPANATPEDNKQPMKATNPMAKPRSLFCKLL